MKRILFLCIVLFLIIGCNSDHTQMTTKQVIKSPEAPEAIGPYSQAILVGNTLYCSGQIAINPETGELVSGTIEEETRQVLENQKAVLKEAGMDFSNVVRATIYMTDMENYGKINNVDHREHWRRCERVHASGSHSLAASNVSERQH